MTLSLEQVQRWVKEWIVSLDPEVEVQVLPPDDNPRDVGEVIPVRLGHCRYRMTVGFPESSFPGSPLPEETCRTLEQVIRLLRHMEARDLQRDREGRDYEVAARSRSRLNQASPGPAQVLQVAPSLVGTRGRKTH